MDITKMLQATIRLDRAQLEGYDVMVGPNARKMNTMMQLNINLATWAKMLGWGDLWPVDHHVTDDEKLAQGIKVLYWALLFSAQQQWTHLVVMDDERMSKIKAAQPVARVDDQAKLYLTMQQFLASAYYNHRQSDFQHAYRLIWKVLWVDLGMSDEVITAAFETYLQTQLQQIPQD